MRAKPGAEEQLQHFSEKGTDELATTRRRILSSYGHVHVDQGHRTPRRRVYSKDDVVNSLDRSIGLWTTARS